MAEPVQTQQHEWQDSQRLIALLGEQRDLYQRLRQLSEQQRTLITGDRPELLLGILRDRQALVGALARLNEQLSPFRQNWDRMYADLAAEARDRVNGLLQEINRLLRVILRTDQEDTALLTARKQAAGQELAALNGGRSAHAAYQPQADKQPAGSADVTG
jgi:hypothetical protein